MKFRNFGPSISDFSHYILFGKNGCPYAPPFKNAKMGQKNLNPKNQKKNQNQNFFKLYRTMTHPGYYQLALVVVSGKFVLKFQNILGQNFEKNFFFVTAPPKKNREKSRLHSPPPLLKISKFFDCLLRTPEHPYPTQNLLLFPSATLAARDSKS